MTPITVPHHRRDFHARSDLHQDFANRSVVSSCRLSLLEFATGNLLHHVVLLHLVVKRDATNPEFLGRLRTTETVVE